MNLIFILFCAAPMLAAPATKSKQRPKNEIQQVSTPPRRDDGVRVLYQKALSKANSGTTQEALDAFEAILRRFPGHQPSVLQYARLLYRVDRIPEAYQSFARINPVGLDPDVSYEYGLTHFWMRQYERSLFAFQRIPEGHALFDLANYYGGISALKLRRLVEADTMMDKAIVLPDKLAKSRQNYVKHISELKLILERRGLEQEKEEERKKVEAKINDQEPGKLSAKETKDLQIRQYNHLGFEEVLVAPMVGYDYKTQVVDKHGFSDETATVKISYFEFKAGPLIRLPLQYGKQQGAFGFQIQARAEEESRQGKERRNVQSDSLEDIQRIETINKDKTLTKVAALSANPWMEVPTPIGLWLSTGGIINFRYPDFETKDRSGRRGGYLRLGVKAQKDPRDLIFLKYGYNEIVDSKNQMLVGVHEAQLQGVVQYLKISRLETNLLSSIYDYADETVPGPATATSLSVDQSILLPAGFSIGLKGSILYQSQYVFYGIPSFDRVEADGQTYTGKLYFNVRPTRWLEAAVSQEIQQTGWQILEATNEKTSAFEQSQPDYQETFQVSLKLNLFF